MAFYDGVLAKIRDLRGLPPVQQPRSSGERAPGEGTSEAPGEGPVGFDLPPGVDFHALWEEPEDPSGLAMILSGVACFLVFVNILITFFHH